MDKTPLRKTLENETPQPSGPSVDKVSLLSLCKANYNSPKPWP